MVLNLRKMVLHYPERRYCHEIISRTYSGTFTGESRFTLIVHLKTIVWVSLEVLLFLQQFLPILSGKNLHSSW